MPNRVQMTVGDNWSLLMPAQVSQLRRKGAITLTKFIQSTDEIAPDDWSWWRLEPPQEIAAKDVAIEVADIEALQSLLVEAAPAPNVEAATDTTTPGAKGITKGAVINAFEGLHFNRDKWSKYLGDPPNWLKECRISRGSKKASALWNPVLIAAALFDKNVPIRKLDAVFAGLKDWTDKWQETAASLRD